MTRLSLNEIQEMQPEPAVHRRLRRREWVAQNWLALLMFAAWLAGQVLGSDRWLQARTSRESELTLQVEQLKAELQTAAQTYVRRDVYAETLRRIDERLASIDSKLERR
jgi:hypothetical protein